MDSTICPKCDRKISMYDEYCPHCQFKRNPSLVKKKSDDIMKVELKDNKIKIIDIDMPFWSMVTFMVRWVIATIPALIILIFIGTFLSALFGGVFTGIFK